jgi:hypothetical protein
MGSPNDFREPVRWMGRAMVGERRMWLWSCEGMRTVMPGLPRTLLIYRCRMNAQFSTFPSDCLRGPQATSEDENDPPNKPAQRRW